MAFGKDTPPEVGLATQWKPGERPAGAGKPKGAKHLSTYIQEMMEDETFTVEYVEGYTLKKHKGAPVKALVVVAFMKALAGDNKWAEWLGKYGYGQKLELANNPDNPITQPVDANLLTQFLMGAQRDTKR